MAAREDQAQPVVLHRASPLIRRWRLILVVQQGSLSVPVVPRRLPPELIDGAVLGGCRDPPARVGRQTGLRPASESNRERVLDRLFGDVNVAEEADQAGNAPAVLSPEVTIDLVAT